jgi:hypothetical protein
VRVLGLPAKDDADRPARAAWLWTIPGEPDWWKRYPLEPLTPLVIAAGFTLVVVLMARALGPVVIALVVFSPFAAVQVLLAFTLLTWGVRAARRHVERGRAALLGAGRCAACRYDLAGIPPGLDGLTVCPECMARWDLTPRLGTVVVTLPA